MGQVHFFRWQEVARFPFLLSSFFFYWIEMHGSHQHISKTKKRPSPEFVLLVSHLVAPLCGFLSGLFLIWFNLLVCLFVCFNAGFWCWVNCVNFYLLETAQSNNAWHWDVNKHFKKCTQSNVTHTTSQLKYQEEGPPRKRGIRPVKPLLVWNNRDIIFRCFSWKQHE